MNIEWKGSPNFDSRNGYKPFVIVNHISGGTIDGMTSWFAASQSQVSSNFGISLFGEIVQYVKIEDRAWCQGIHLPLDPALKLAPVIRAMGNVNPNNYSVSIEHEGTVGDLTEPQFYASCWLHRFIKDEVKRIYNVDIKLGDYHVVGHFQIDPVRKPYCPGPKFNWIRLYAELAIADGMTLADYEQRLVYLQSDAYKQEKCFKLMNSIDYIVGKLTDADAGTAGWASATLKTVCCVFADQSVLVDKYSATSDYKQFKNDVLYIYNNAVGKDSYSIGLLNKVYPILKTKGLVA
jgi:N-acetylmuramoyl-L-alanine amidase